MDDKTVIDKNFDLEQRILQCWHVCDDLADIAKLARESGQEEIAQTLEGFRTVYNMRFNCTFSVYEEVCRGLHQFRSERNKMAAQLQAVEETFADVVKKQHQKKVKSMQQKEVDQ